MNLPRRGALVNPDGQIVWAWEHNDPTREFDAIPPLITDMDGKSRFANVPDAVILDLEAVTEPGDMVELYRDMDKTRVRKDGKTGKWQISCVVGQIDDPKNPGRKIDFETAHPITARMEARKALEEAKKQQPTPTPPPKPTPPPSPTVDPPALSPKVSSLLS